ncbi:MAG: PAS domain S-box protein [Methanolinea sp.]|jgi:PAS domain S-box-containing protein|nr:PAS domain S-box protein [Methanolinea sp.]
MISVLYVDDEPGLLDIVKLKLEQTRLFKVDTSGSAQNALIKLKETKYDAVVSDYQMQGMDGIEFLRAVRKEYPRLPFIIFTGRGREGVVIEALNNGVDYYLQKGTGIKALFAELQNMLTKAVEKKRLEDALIESETRYREFFTTSRDSVFITSPEGIWIDFNDAIVELFGYESREEFSQVPVPDVYAEKGARLAFHAIIQREGYVKEHPMEGRKKDGTVIDTLITAVPVRNQDGRVKAFIGTIRDVTERKRAEEALKESEEKYRILAENAPIGILTCDSLGQIVYLNPKVLDILGSPGEEKTREINLLHFPPLQEVGFAEALQRSLETGVPIQSIEAEYTSKWGKTVYFRTHISPYIRNNSIQSAQIILDDITQQKHLEEALLASEERYKNVVQTQTEFITRFFPDGTHIFVNDAYCKYFGKTPQEMVGHRFFPNIPKEDISHIREHFSSLTKERPVGTSEHRIIMPDGEVRWQQWNDRAIFNERGELVEYQSVGRDITDRIRMEEALRNSEKLGHGIIDHLPDATLVVNTQGEVIVWNHAMEELTKVPASEMLGKGNYAHGLNFYGEPRPILVDLVLKEDTELLKTYSYVKREGNTLIAETPVIHFRDRDVILWGKASPLYDQNGMIIGAIETIRDVSGIKRSG